MLCRYLELKRFKFPYDVEETIEDKIRAIATEFYGTGAIYTSLVFALCVSSLSKRNRISDTARCSCSGGARGVGGLTCGPELELQLSDQTGVKNKHF